MSSKSPSRRMEDPLLINSTKIQKRRHLGIPNQSHFHIFQPLLCYPSLIFFGFHASPTTVNFSLCQLTSPASPRFHHRVQRCAAEAPIFGSFELRFGSYLTQLVVNEKRPTSPPPPPAARRLCHLLHLLHLLHRILCRCCYQHSNCENKA